MQLEQPQRRWAAHLSRGTLLSAQVELGPVAPGLPMCAHNVKTTGAMELSNFERHTNRVADTVIVLACSSIETITETVALHNGMLMDDAPRRDALATPHLPSPPKEPTKVGAGYITAALPPRGVRMLSPVVPDAAKGYSVYKRIP